MARAAVVLGDIVLDIRGSLTDEFAVAIANDATADARMTLALAGTGVGMARALTRYFDTVQLIGALGDDTASRLVQMLLADEPVQTLTVTNHGAQAGTALVLRDGHPDVPHGQRIVAISRGANDTLTTVDVADMRSTIEAAELLCVDGYGLLHQPRRDATLLAMRLARQVGHHVFLDLVPHDLVRHWTLEDCRRSAVGATIVGSSGTTLAHLLGVPWPGCMRPLDHETAIQVATQAADQLGPKTYLVHYGQGHCTETIAYRDAVLWAEDTDYPTVPRDQLAGFGDRMSAHELHRLLTPAEALLPVVGLRCDGQRGVEVAG